MIKMNEERVNNAILTLEVLIDCCKEDGTYYNAQKEWEALEVFKQLQNNWNELKKWLESWLENDKHCYLAENSIDKCRCEVYKELLNKMQELEQGKYE